MITNMIKIKEDYVDYNRINIVLNNKEILEAYKEVFKLSPDHKEILRQANLGKIVSKETRDKISIKQKGIKLKDRLSSESMDNFHEAMINRSKENHHLFKGYYITPFGRFASRPEIKEYFEKNNINTSYRAVYNRCKKNVKKPCDYVFSDGTIYSDYWFEESD